MLKNYFITAIRNFRKNKVYTALNILSLSFGLTCCLVQYAVYRHEFNFDQFHPKVDRIYRVVEHYVSENGMEYSGILANPLARALDAEKSRISDVISMHGPVHGKIKISVGNKLDVMTESRALFTESSFLQHLDFPLIAGGPIELLDEKGNVFITESLAQKYFGPLDPLGRVIQFEDLSLTVTGILADPPTNTNVPFRMLISEKHLRDVYHDYVENWESKWTASAYVVIEPGDQLTTLEAEINEIFSKHISKEEKELKQLYLQPLSEVHTDDRYSRAVNYVPPSKVMMGSFLIALLILIVSILNFINLATSQSIRRAKEIGIRKTLGGQKRQLIFQFLTETMLQVIVSALIGLTLGQILMDQLNSAVSGMSFHVGYDATIILYMTSLILLVTVLGGAYPSFILTRFNPVQTLHRQISLTKNSGSFSLRKTMITAQFIIANILIIAMIISGGQMQYIQQKDLGFDPANVMIIGFPDQSSDKMPVIKHEYEKLNFVQEASWAFTPPQTGNSWNCQFNIAGEETNDNLVANMKFIDDAYMDLYDIKLLYGKNPGNTYSTDSTAQLLVSEELIKRLNLTIEEAMRTRIQFNGEYEGQIVGITEDFHVSKLNRGIKPVIMMHNPGLMKQIHLKMASEDIHLNELRSVFRKFDQENIFEPSILTERIQKSYTFENIIFSSVLIFSFCAIIISLMGLYGLVSFMIAKNQKPISIRKIFGASTNRLMLNLSKEYLTLILLAFVIAAPLSFLAMTNWLNTFYYHIEVAWWHFAISLILIIFIALATVGLKSYRAATSNPVDAIRNE